MELILFLLEPRPSLGVLFRLLKISLVPPFLPLYLQQRLFYLSTILVLLFLNSIGVVDIWSGEGLLHAHDGEGNHHHGHSSFHIGIVLTGWGAVLTVVLAGIVLETVITILIIRFFQKMQSDLVQPLSGRK